MCELLVCEIAETNPASRYLDTKLPKQGDCIYAAEDGHGWGGAEQTNPMWRILRLPGVDASAVAALLRPEAPTAALPANQPNTLQYRGFFIDRTQAALPADLAAYLADDTRAAASYTVPATLDLTIFIQQRPPVPDPQAVPSPTPG